MGQSIPNSQLFQHIITLRQKGHEQEASELHQEWLHMPPYGEPFSSEPPTLHPLDVSFIRSHQNPTPTSPPPGTHYPGYGTGDQEAARLIQFFSDYDFTHTRTDQEGLAEAHQAWCNEFIHGELNYQYGEYDPDPAHENLPQHLFNFYVGQRRRSLYTYKRGLYLTDHPLGGPSAPGDDTEYWMSATSEPADPNPWIQTERRYLTSYNLPGSGMYDGFSDERHELAEEWATHHVILNNPDDPLQGATGLGAELIWQEPQESTYNCPSLAELWRDTLTGHVYLRDISINNADPDDLDAQVQWRMQGLTRIVQTESPVLFPQGDNPTLHPEKFQDLTSMPRYSPWRFAHLIREELCG